MVFFDEYIAKKVYNGKTIEINIFDFYVDEERITKLLCYKYDRNIITLNNATDEQIKCEIRNLFRLAEEKIDDDSLVNKIKKLFK